MVTDLNMAIKSPNHGVYLEKIIMYYVFQFLQCLGNLAACSDVNIGYLIEAGILPALENIITGKDSTDEELLPATRLCILISLSGEQKYKDQLKANTSLLKG